MAVAPVIYEVAGCTMNLDVMKEDKDLNRHRSDAIVQWLSEHPLISRNALCNLAGYTASDLLKCFNGARVIPKKYLSAFEKELSRYGYIACMPRSS